MTLRALLVAVFVSASLATIPLANAQDDFFEPAALGMGGAVRILGGDTSSIHLNPAAMVGRPKYVASMSYGFYGREASHTVASGAYDSRSSNFALGTKYTVWNFTPPFDPDNELNWFPVESTEGLEDKRTWQRWDIAAAYAFLGRRINVGLTARIIRQKFELYDDRTFFTMDGGFTFFLIPQLGIGIAAENFIPTNDSRFKPRLAPGIGLLIDNFLHLEADVVMTFEGNPKPTTDLHVGTEITLFRAFSIRGGFYSERQFTENYVTWGLGLAVPRAKMRLAYSMRIEVGPMDRALREEVPEHRNRLMHSLGFDVTF